MNIDAIGSNYVPINNDFFGNIGSVKKAVYTISTTIYSCGCYITMNCYRAAIRGIYSTGNSGHITINRYCRIGPNSRPFTVNLTWCTFTAYRYSTATVIHSAPVT